MSNKHAAATLKIEDVNGCVSVTDAREMWCPYSRARLGAGDMATVANRANRISVDDTDTFDFTTDFGPSTSCLATSCMVWRTTRIVDGEAYGYCGHAGKPEVA